MIIYCDHITNRVTYMAAWLGNYLFGKPLQVTANITLPELYGIINYSASVLPAASYHIQPAGLLFQHGISKQAITVSGSERLPYFFATNGKHPFDILSAIFFLISRYEEYLPHKKDEYGRYWHKESVAFKNGFLHRPLIDEWMDDLKNQLRSVFPELIFRERVFEYQPTYDVDIAWCYKNKEWVRTAGGFFKDTINGNWRLSAERLLVLAGKKPDPFDVFEELDLLHEKHRLNPHYFFLLANKLQGYDKNISPFNPSYQALIRGLASKYKTGIHLSWQSAAAAKVMKLELSTLEGLTGKAVNANRMHYINFHLPGTFETLLSLGIKIDYSMGYGTINGFRAGTCTPFHWYNLAKEAETDLEIIPYCYMEANSIFEQKDSPEEALVELQQCHDITKKLRGRLVTIFHNHLVGLSSNGRDWMEMYKQFLTRNF